MERLGNKFSFTPADAERGGGRLRIERFETVFGAEGMQYLALRDIQRNLVPALRREQYEDVVLVIYKGDSDEVLAELSVHDDGQKTTLRDEEGTAISLFSPTPGARIQRPREGEERRVPIYAWLKNKGYRTDEVTFCPFFKQAQEAEDTEVAESNEDETGTAPEVSESDVAVPDAKTRKKPVRKRPISVRRKRTRQEIKEKKQERAEQEYKVLLNYLQSQSVENINPESLTPLFVLASFLRTNPAFMQRIVAELQSNDRLKHISQSLIHFKAARFRANISIEQRHHNSELATNLANLGILQKLASQIFVEFDSNRRALYEYSPYQMDRDILRYWSGLFSEDMTIEDFINMLESVKNEVWVDIGSGTTYQNPNALINIIKKVNPSVQMIGVDPLYDVAKARKLDIVTNRAGIDTRFGDGHILLGDYAQKIHLETTSVDKVLSFGVFDKFNISNESELQAFYELARILKHKGEARIYPVRKKFIDQNRSELERFFEIQETRDSEYRGEKMLLLKLIRKQGTSAELLQLEKRSESWH